MAPAQHRNPIPILLRYITDDIMFIVACTFDIIKAILSMVACIPMLVCLLLVIILTIPYTFYFWSSNFGTRTRDMPILQLYLDHFETLHPELAAALERAFDACGPNQRLLLVFASSWPHSLVGYDSIDVEKGADIKYTTMDGYRFSLASGFFMLLEDAGFARQTLMEFLMHDVESNVKVDEKERADYRRVMHKLCSHCTSHLLGSLLPFGVSRYMTNGEGFLTPAKSALGFRPYLMRTDRKMDWVLQQGAVLVPMDGNTYWKAKELARFGLWKAVMDDADLAGATHEAYWQLVDLR